MGRPKKSKAALLANISKNGKSAGDKCTKIVDHNDQEYVAKSNSKASRFNDKVSKENVNELLVVHESDSPTEISYEKVEIPVKSKTWLRNVRNPAKVQFDNFIFYNQPRHNSYDDSANFKNLKEKDHGGVGIYYSKNKACNIIRPPRYRLELFMPQLERLLTELQESGYHYIIMGDFNQNLLEGHSSINDCFQDFGFKQCVTESTTEGNTILDHVYMSSETVQIYCCILKERRWVGKTIYLCWVG
ncbi:hypothetical protein LOTGIDRAFT_175646, partial [Lottia gigantea]